MKTALLDHLVSVGNKSGAMPSMPAALKKLKAGIEAVPFSVDVPGMSQILSMANIVPELVARVKELGSLAAVGEFKNILGRVSGLQGDISQVSEEQLISALKGAVGVDEIEAAVGRAVAMSSALGKLSGE